MCWTCLLIWSIHLPAHLLIVVDLDECSSQPNTCGPKATCRNTLGYYACDCNMGHRSINHTHCQGELLLLNLLVTPAGEVKKGNASKHRRKMLQSNLMPSLMSSIFQPIFRLPESADILHSTIFRFANSAVCVAILQISLDLQAAQPGSAICCSICRLCST